MLIDKKKLALKFGKNISLKSFAYYSEIGKRLFFFYKLFSFFVLFVRFFSAVILIRKSFFFFFFRAYSDRSFLLFIR